MKYVEFGAQENRDFDYEKFVIGERIQENSPVEYFYLVTIVKNILNAPLVF